MIRALIISLRPKQWIKNIIVFAGLFFAEDIFDPPRIKAAFIAFVLFCLVSSAGYLLNDVLDRQKDALHPRKKNRPIAAGELSPTIAISFALFLLVFATITGLATSRILFGFLLLYFTLTFTYSAFLKRLIIIDVIVISTGFMLRAIAGVLVIEEPISSWLIICTIFLSLFLALNKRYAEVLALGDEAGKVRKTLTQYSPKFLEQMIMIVSASAMISYALYTLDSETIAKFDSRNLIFTLPFVIYGLFRYLYLVQNESQGESPENVIIQDRPLFLNIILYGLAVILIIYM